MRTILFRGKHHERWAEGSLILAEDFCCILEDENSMHPTDYPFLMGDLGVIDGKATVVDPDSVGQYTGLTDKNGKRIFEGDIIKARIEEVGASYQGYEWPAMRVDFINGAFCLSHTTKGTLCNFNGFAPSVTFEVIGNIHDNPELIKEG